MQYEYFDIHSHLNFSDYDDDRESVIAEMKEKKIGTICIGTGEKTSLECIELAERHENIFASVGIHPHDSGQISDIEKTSEILSEYAKHPRVVAIGECGLDYAGEVLSKENQKKLFEKQIQISLDLNKPLMIHCRNAYDDLLEILKSYKKSVGDKLKGNLHFFSGSIDELEQALDLGLTVSFTGVITFAESYRALVEYSPLEKIMAETDAPYVAPVPYRGKRNSPLYVQEIVKKIAEIKQIDLETVRLASLNNSIKFFSI